MFHLKQFSIEDSGATMKVGTDAVLLGALAEPFVRPTRILDIGTGCGILAMMMAQRFPTATIDAIDIDDKSVEIAIENVQRSPWPKRIHCHKISLQDFVYQQKKEYDLIISNPPYFSNSLRNNEAHKRLARHDDALPPSLLFSLSEQLLTTEGTIWISCPTSEQEKFSNAARKTALNPIEIINLCTSSRRPPTLSILSFSKKKTTSHSVSTYNMRESNNQLSAWYHKITEPFLL